MALYLIGLGLGKESLSLEGLRKLKECSKIYLENYTVNFPYSKEELEKSLGIKVSELNREEVENESILKEAKEREITLLVYGDPLSATTHSSLVLACKEKKIPFKIFHNASIISTVSETGLQPYKFGKVTSIPNWKEHKNNPSSFVKTIKENSSIEAHTLMLVDIGLDIKEAFEELKESCKKEKIEMPEKVIILSNAGTSSQKVYYGSIEYLKSKKISLPYCIIIPNKLHFIEEEYLNEFKED